MRKIGPARLWVVLGLSSDGGTLGDLFQMSTNKTKVTALEPGNRVELPAEWTDGLGISGLVTLERTDDGILVAPCPRFTWDDIFATRLSVRQGDSAIPPDISELSGDDLLAS
jgi:hypothetical protein